MCIFMRLAAELGAWWRTMVDKRRQMGSLEQGFLQKKGAKYMVS
jgi:hypothetical protein